MGTKKRRVLVEQLIIRDGTECTWCCREMIDLPIDPRMDCSLHMTLEHLVPLSLGGTHEPSNLALACFQCNNERGSSLEFEAPWSV
jgi:5-methylcytosine-specific restriction endonuclease McrA